mmetsp:Transcript_6796/g.16688  ORF Transcript_6796/g.16688 Transcript_6796/m.16688 type:complete len:80 (-) Transcript_6796:2287-2526(-)
MLRDIYEDGVLQRTRTTFLIRSVIDPLHWLFIPREASHGSMILSEGTTSVEKKEKLRVVSSQQVLHFWFKFRRYNSSRS